MISYLKLEPRKYTEKCRQERQEIFYDDHESVSEHRDSVMYDNDPNTDTCTTKEPLMDNVQEGDYMLC